jgi:Lon protease-like protein
MTASMETNSKKKRVTIPLFPLTNAVFFPKTTFPIHVFEERYLRMTDEAMKGEKMIGIILLKKGWHHNYFGQPEIYRIGTVGKIREFQTLPDGTYNIVLQGIQRFRIIKEHHDSPYRQADVELLPNEPIGASEETIQQEKQSLIHIFSQFLKEVKEYDLPLDLFSQNLPYDELVNLTIHYFDHLMSKKQDLLEENNVYHRGIRLKRLIENRIIQHQISDYLDNDYEGSPFS